jgi:predicted exporter/lauroyl/myristoyl acyltransferase
MNRLIRSLLLLLLLTLIVAGLLRLRFDADVLNLLPGEVPAVQGLKVYQEHFLNARELILTIQASDPEEAENTARILAERLRPVTNLIAELTWQPPWLEHPGLASELIAYLWLNQPPELFAQLTNRFAPAQLARTLTAIREQLATSMSPGDIARLSYDPLGLTQLPEGASSVAPSFGEGQELFSSADGTFRIVFVQAAGSFKGYRESLHWFESVKQLVRETRIAHRISPEVQIGYTGGPAFVSEISSGMEKDLRKSVSGALAVIVILFWIFHRRLKPLLWLLALLAFVLVGTLAVGGLVIGTVNVVSVGFAAILMGLSADYGLVLYQEWLHSPTMETRELRRKLARGIIWSAVTTAGAFLILNLGDLPGLAQLGTLVAIGVALAAIVMLTLFLPPLRRGLPASVAPSSKPNPAKLFKYSKEIGWAATALVAIAATTILFRAQPALDHTTNSLRPRSSPAYGAMEQIKTNLAGSGEPDWLIISGRTEQEVARKTSEVEAILTTALSNKQIENYTLPASLLPNPGFHKANQATAKWLSGQQDFLKETAQAHGFTGNSIAFTEDILARWQMAAATDGVLQPTNQMSRWVFDKVIARDATNLYALGLVYPANNATTGGWRNELSRDGVWLAGWERLGSDLLDIVERDLWRVLLPMLALLIVALSLAFRRGTEVILSLVTLLFSGVCLWAFMGIMGWSWNLLNLLALPLMLGAGVDYSIHMQLALRRHGGNVSETRRIIGRALMLCAGTTAAGFGSNAWSSNAGLASLGLVAAAGVAAAFLTSYFLLPVWWQTFARQDSTAPSGSEASSELSAPSSLYRAEFWRLGLWIVRICPRAGCLAAGRFFAGLYWHFAKQRREVLIHNLLPALNNDRTAAAATSKDLLRQFAIKIVDLWRYEAGIPVEQLLGEASGWDHFAQAKASGRGVLLLTPHLGNWEFGGPWMTRRGVTLLVISLAEPGKNFTELRQASRARWNIETIVIGNDPFAFLEIIKRLEAGATVALLMDRPPAPTAVEVELFGRPFLASIAAAELARASGCVLMPVYIPFTNNAYAAHILPPVSYERPGLRNRGNRLKLTQEIMRAFEPAIRKHIDQWYHFIPIWPQK